MNRKIYISLISAAFAAAAPMSLAQDLKKDVVIERDVQPAERAATRLSTVAPTILSPKVEKRKLQLSEYTGTGTLNCRLPLLEPAAYADTFAVSPYRGYAGIGYFPGFNLGASAGYRFINTRHTTLGAWLQYDGNSYNSEKETEAGETAEKYKLTRHTFTLGADFEHDFRVGSLGIDFDYTHNYVTMPFIAEDFKQSTNKVGLGVEWEAHNHNLPWHIGMDLDYFGFAKAQPAHSIIGYELIDPDPVHELIFGIEGGIAKRFDNSSIGLDVDARFQNLNRLSYPYAIVNIHNSGDAVRLINDNATTLGITSLSPHYTFSNGQFSAKLGAKVDISTGGLKSGVFFSPDVNVAYAPSSQVAFFAKVDGGKELTELSELFDDTQFMSSAYSYERGKVPFDAKLGINIGALAGFTAEVWAGYSKASDWAMPAFYNDIEYFQACDVKGFRYGARLGWQYNNVFKIHAQAEGSQQGDGKGYYKWRDNAKWVIDAGFTVTPVKALDISVDWHLRTSRSMFETHPDVTTFVGSQLAYWDYETYDLGSSNNLNISALYRINDAWSAFVNVENLLSKHWYITPELQNQGIHGLFGITYKF